MTIAKTIVLFALAAAAEIGGAWLVWQAVREDRAWWWASVPHPTYRWPGRSNLPQVWPRSQPWSARV